MEASFQAVRLSAYTVNRTRRLIKSPKFYWSDTGLALFLAGERETGNDGDVAGIVTGSSFFEKHQTGAFTDAIDRKAPVVNAIRRLLLYFKWP